ncbi:MAG TPA: 3-dehydroquinate synthase [Bacillota bacterium]|nr:3-dehydroquinate synthase [Bacillota bacterium]
MKTIHVQASTHSYDVTIGENIHCQLEKYVEIDAYSSVFVITDEHVYKHYGDSFIASIPHNRVSQVIIPSGEQSKSFEQYYDLLTKALSEGIDRKGLIIAFGGGVVGDIAGFVASTLLRGIDYIQVPTTILAHDSSVGGKVAINHPLGKNLIGHFYAPKAVVYDVALLKSLPPHEIRSGYTEIIKEALIDHQSLFEEMIARPLTNCSTKDFIPFIQKGIEIKARIVEEDERESGVRAFLNLGHTLGHAIEADAGYGTLTHGEAVAIGLLFSLYVSEKTFSNALPLQSLYQWFIQNKYPIRIDAKRIPNYIELMKKDKKVHKDHIHMVLLKEIGKPSTVGLTPTQLTSLLNEFIEEMHTW